MDNQTEVTKCCCSAASETKTAPATQAPKQVVSGKKATVQSVRSILLSVLVAFFPKCPVCWAVYMSMFGCVGIAKLPYMAWLLPVLLVFLGVHIFMLYKKAARVGYLPFSLSLLGSAAILFTRAFLPDAKWLTIFGMVCIISGSLINSFSVNPIKLRSQFAQ